MIKAIENIVNSTQRLFTYTYNEYAVLNAHTHIVQYSFVERTLNRKQEIWVLDLALPLAGQSEARWSWAWDSVSSTVQQEGEINVSKADPNSDTLWARTHFYLQVRLVPTSTYQCGVADCSASFLTGLSMLYQLLKSLNDPSHFQPPPKWWKSNMYNSLFAFWLLHAIGIFLILIRALITSGYN